MASLMRSSSMKPVILPITQLQGELASQGRASDTLRCHRRRPRPTPAPSRAATKANELSRRSLLPAGSRCVRLDLGGVLFTERTPILVRKHLDELAARGFPMIEDRERERAAGELEMALDERAQQSVVGVAKMQNAPL